MKRLTLAIVAAGALAGCSPVDAPGADFRRQALGVPHTFDLSTQLPPHLAVMFSMSWFGIPASDPQGAGPDPSYGNSKWGGGCVAINDPSQCSSCILYGAGDVCSTNGAGQRATASRRRMLAGPYSASAKDAEGRARVDLMLSNLRRPCDDGAKLDAWTVQLNGTRDTSAHPANPSCSTCEIAYGATLGFLSRADLAGLTNVIIPGDDATWYFHFGANVGLGKCDDSTGNPKQNCIDALAQDVTDMVSLALAHPSALRLNGNPVVYFYVDPGYLTDTEWSAIFQTARDNTNHDFYTVASLQNPTRTNFFNAFDALSPWVQLSWTNYSGATTRAHAQAWAAGEHDPIFNAVGNYPGRVAFGGIAPGFDDWTMNWGACSERQLPPGSPRDPAVLEGEFDYLAAHSAKGMILETWDDWTEGSEFEPDVEGGSAVLVALRDQLGALFNEPADPAGDARLSNRWSSYGQARNCSGGAAGIPPVTDLSCPDAGVDAGADAGNDAGTPDAGVDAGVDAGADAGTPADAGHDAGTDGGTGPAPDAGTPGEHDGARGACGCGGLPVPAGYALLLLWSASRRRQRATGCRCS